jgi:hypothetical protein
MDCVQLRILERIHHYRKLCLVDDLAFLALKFGDYRKLKYYEAENNFRLADHASFKATYVIKSGGGNEIKGAIKGLLLLWAICRTQVAYIIVTNKAVQDFRGDTGKLEGAALARLKVQGWRREEAVASRRRRLPLA